jgi:hypothetical protein
MNENNGNNETQKTAGTEKIRKRDLVKQYQDELNKLNALPDDSSSDSEIEVIKAPREKRERTQAQKDAFERARLARETKVKQRKDENEILKKSQQKEVEDKLIKKAISTKKKQLKEIAKKIEEESDNDDPPNTKTPIMVGGTNSKSSPSKPPSKSIPKEEIIVEPIKPKYKFL